MSAEFDHAFEIVIGLEGAPTNDPNDPGGLTRWGIAQNANPDIDVASLTLDQAKSRYLHRYWIPAGCEYIAPWPLSLYMFDCAVNQGVGTAIRLLQKAAEVPQDGILGIVTEKAVATAKLDELCASFLAERALRYTGTHNFDHFGRGWFRRLFKLPRMW